MGQEEGAPQLRAHLRKRVCAKSVELCVKSMESPKGCEENRGATQPAPSPPPTINDQGRGAGRWKMGTSLNTAVREVEFGGELRLQAIR